MGLRVGTQHHRNIQYPNWEGTHQDHRVQCRHWGKTAVTEVPKAPHVSSVSPAHHSTGSEQSCRNQPADCPPPPSNPIPPRCWSSMLLSSPAQALLCSCRESARSLTGSNLAVIKPRCSGMALQGEQLHQHSERAQQKKKNNQRKHQSKIEQIVALQESRAGRGQRAEGTGEPQPVHEQKELGRRKVKALSRLACTRCQLKSWLSLCPGPPLPVQTLTTGDFC